MLDKKRRPKTHLSEEERQIIEDLPMQPQTTP